MRETATGFTGFHIFTSQLPCVSTLDEPCFYQELLKIYLFQSPQKPDIAPALRDHSSSGTMVAFVPLVTTSRDHDSLRFIKSN